MDKSSILKFFGVGIALSIPDTNDPDGWLYVMPIETIPGKEVKICLEHKDKKDNKVMQNSMITDEEDKSKDTKHFENYDKKLLSDCVGGESNCYEDFELKEWEKKNKVKYKDIEFDLEQDTSEPVIKTKKDEKPILSYPYIKAKWLRIGWDVNRITPYHITRGEQVLLFRYGSSIEFFWLPMIMPYNTMVINGDDENTESIYSHTNIDRRVSEDVKYEFNKVELEGDNIKKDKYKFYISPKENRILIEHNTPSSGDNVGRWKLEMTTGNTYIGEKSGTSFTNYEKKNITISCEELLNVKCNTWDADTGEAANFTIGTSYNISVGSNYNLTAKSRGNISASGGLNLSSGGTINESASAIRMNCGGGLDITGETVEKIKKNADKINKAKAEALMKELKNTIGDKYYINEDGVVVDAETGNHILDEDKAPLIKSILEGKMPEYMSADEFLKKTKDMGLNDKYDPVPTNDKDLVTALTNDPDSLLYAKGSKLSNGVMSAIINGGSMSSNTVFDSNSPLANDIKQRANLTDDELNVIIKARKEGLDNLTAEELRIRQAAIEKLNEAATTFLKEKFGYEEAGYIVSMAEVGYVTNPPKGRVYLEDFFLGKNLEGAVPIGPVCGEYNVKDAVEKAIEGVVVGATYASLTGMKVKQINGTKLTETEAKAYKEYLETGSVSDETINELVNKADEIEPRTVDIREIFPDIDIVED